MEDFRELSKDFFSQFIKRDAPRLEDFVEEFESFFSVGDRASLFKEDTNVCRWVIHQTYMYPGEIIEWIFTHKIPFDPDDPYPSSDPDVYSGVFYTLARKGKIVVSDAGAKKLISKWPIKDIRLLIKSLVDMGLDFTTVNEYKNLFYCALEKCPIDPTSDYEEYLINTTGFDLKSPIDEVGNTLLGLKASDQIYHGVGGITQTLKQCPEVLFIQNNRERNPLDIMLSVLPRDSLVVMLKTIDSLPLSEVERKDFYSTLIKPGTLYGIRHGTFGSHDSMRAIQCIIEITGERKIIGDKDIYGNTPMVSAIMHCDSTCASKLYNYGDPHSDTMITSILQGWSSINWSFFFDNTLFEWQHDISSVSRELDFISKAANKNFKQKCTYPSRIYSCYILVFNGFLDPKPQQSKRFWEILRKLPPELVMEICKMVFGQMNAKITNEKTKLYIQLIMERFELEKMGNIKRLV